MLELAIALVLCGMTLQTLQGGVTAEGRMIRVADPGFSAIGIGLAIVLMAGIVFGPVYGLALVLAVLVHEFGQFAARRIAGQSDTLFRLIPFDGLAATRPVPDTQEQDFFIAIMGPGISLAPMVTAHAAALLLADAAPQLSQLLFALATTIAALNLLNLLPFWPLDGGRILRILCMTYWPGDPRYVALGFSAAAAAAAVHIQSFGILLFVLFGTQSMMTQESRLAHQPPMDQRKGRRALAAYGFTLAAHLTGCWSLFVWLQ